jgi:hypothetical protein
LSHSYSPAPENKYSSLKIDELCAEAGIRFELRPARSLRVHDSRRSGKHRLDPFRYGKRLNPAIEAFITQNIRPPPQVLFAKREVFLLARLQKNTRASDRRNQRLVRWMSPVEAQKALAQRFLRVLLLEDSIGQGRYEVEAPVTKVRSREVFT